MTILWVFICVPVFQISSIEDGCCARQNSINECPEGLLSFTSGICYTLLSNQTFPPKCPYQNFLPYHKMLFMFHILNLEEEEIWINAVRNDSANFGNYEWIERSNYFGETIRSNIDTSNFSVDHRCLTVRNNMFVPSSCSSFHSSLCVYKYHTSQYCSNNYKHGNCTSAHFDFYNGECYCNVKLEEPKSKLIQPCQKLAEPKLPFQTHLLLSTFIDSEVCWFGLSKTANCTFAWSSQTEVLQYNYWSNNVDCNYHEGAISFEEDNGWLLLNDTLLNCSLCHVSIQPKQVTLELYHDLNKDVLTLLIKNPFSISDWSGQFNVYCFSTTNTDDFKYKLNVNLTGIGSNDTVAVIELPQIKEYPGHYWCSAFQFPYNDIVHSNTIVTYNRTNRYGFEYSLSLTIRTFGNDPLLSALHVHACNIISLYLSSYDNIMTVRPMKVVGYNDTQDSLEIVVHITTKNAHQSHKEEYYTLLQALYVVNLSNPHIIIGELLSTIVCFTKYTVTPDGDVLEWPETNIGVTAIPLNKLCVNSSTDAVPVTRKCEGSFMDGAKWADVQGTCAKDVNYTQSTKELFYLLKLGTFEQGIEDILAEITASAENPSIIDVYLVSSILSKIADQNTKPDIEFFIIIENLMKYNRTLLNDSQGLLNSTDQVLFSLDNALIKLNEDVTYKSNNLIVRIIDLRSIESVTVLLHKDNQSEGTNSLNSYSLTVSNDSRYKFNDDKTAEMAIIISNSVLIHIKNQTNSETPLKLVVSLFNNDFLFNQQDNKLNYYVDNKIVSIIWIGFNGYLKSPIQIMFKKSIAEDRSSRCGYWDYGWDQLMISKYGRWAFDNSSVNTTSEVELCEFYHTTHFGLLLVNNSFEVLLKHEQYLNIVFAIGSALSLIGIVPIFLTAIFHKPWRSRPATKILIQLCVTIVIQTILLFLSDVIQKDGVFCKITGVITHYIVLAEFCWMFVIGLLQYRKFVVIMKPQPTNVLQISAIIGWGVPVIPIFISLAISTDNYGLVNNRLCYVGERYVFLFLLLPIILMYVANVYIFIRIFYSIQRVNANSAVKVKNFKAEIFLAILLFFTLGLTWIFAFVDVFGGGIVFTYLFSLTASIRGFVLFIFFIVRNKEVRHLWLKETNTFLDRSFVSKDNRFSEVSLDHSSF